MPIRKHLYLLLAPGLMLYSIMSCKVNLPEPAFLPDEILSSVTDSFSTNSEGTHYGHIEITNGIAVIQAFDKPTRQQQSITVLDLNKKKSYGTFPWPDPQGSWYFGIAPYKDTLLYFSNYEYFRKINIETHVVDTVMLKSGISELDRMIVIGSKAYSLENIYGVNIVDINKTELQLFLKPYRGFYYNEQNSISVPVQKNINLVSSCEVSEKEFALYAIDSTMKIQWTKNLKLNNEHERITTLWVEQGFLVKYDNKLLLLNKTDGSTIWEKVFDLNILKILPIDRNSVLLFLSDAKADGIPLGKAILNRKLLKYNIVLQKEDWTIRNSGDDVIENSFIMKNYLYSFTSNDGCSKVRLNNGALKVFDCKNSQPEVIADQYDGKQYLLLNNRFYW